MASSYKFCVIATGELIFMQQKKELTNGIMLLHAVAQNAGAIIKTLDENPLYGKEDYKIQVFL